jgi:hypothetical protein
MNLDTAQSAFFKRQLEYVKGQTYDEKLKDLKAFQAFPISSEVPSGATEVTWRSFKSYGFAKFISDYAKDFPRADVGGTEYTRKIFDIGLAYGYSLREIQRAALANLPLDSKRALAVRRGIEQKLNTIAFSGHYLSTGEEMIPGFITYPAITEYAVPATGTSTTKTWSTKTAAQILVDLNGIANAVSEGTSGKEEVNVIALPHAQYNLIKQTQFNAYSDKSIYTFFLENNPGVEIVWWGELNEAGASSTDRFMAYVKDAQHVTFEIPTMFEQLEEEREGPMAWSVPAVAQTAGVIVYYPAAVAFGDGI